MKPQTYHNLAILVLIGIGMIVLSASGTANIWNVEINAGVKSSTAELVTPLQSIGGASRVLGNLINIQNENESLRKQIQELNLKLDSYKTLAGTLDTIKSTGSKPDSIVNIINPVSTLTNGYIYIDRGSADQVNKGDLITYGNYLVGVVDIVAINYSKVVTVTSVDSKLPVGIGSHFGTAMGVANLAIRVEEVDPRAKINVGDDVNIIPTNSNPLLGKYKLGKVAKVASSEAAPTQSIEVNYPLNLFDLKQAELVKHK
jgi:cell shape-determining protein MreC